MSHIAIKLGGEYLAHKPGTSIEITDSNPYFNDQSETLSLPFQVPVEGNRNVLCDVDCPESDFRLTSHEGKVLGFEVDGILLRSGKLGSIDDQEISDEVSLQMVSAVYSLDDYLSGLRCRDVALKDRIQVGEGIGNVSVRVNTEMDIIVKHRTHVPSGYTDTETKYHAPYPIRVDQGMSFPALGFSRPDVCKVVGSGLTDYQASDGSDGKEPTVVKSFINVAEPYDPGRGFYYCNGRVCYLHHKKEKNSDNQIVSSEEVDTTASLDQYSKYNPYMVLEANRPASGLCFYVLYFLDCLFYMFRNDGISYDNSELLRVPDLKRLAFFTTAYKFDAQPKMGLRPLNSVDEIHNWLTSRRIRTKLEVVDSGKDSHLDHITIDGKDYIVDGTYTLDITVKHSYDKVKDVAMTAQVMEYFANSQNFPDADAKTILDSLWGSFGIRFYLDQETRVVKPRFVRDIFRDQSEPIVFPGVVLSATPMTEKTTGFRMRYSNESDDQAKKDKLINATTDYNTTYDYCDYSQPNILYTYIDILGMAYDTNTTLYIDLMTGNRYRVKIDGEAETRSEYHPVIFEVGQLTGVEIGDCSKENQDYIYEVVSSFEPVIFNDVNNINQRKAFTQEETFTAYIQQSPHTIGAVSKYEKRQILAPFVDEDMWHENIPRTLSYPIGTKFMEINLNATIDTAEAYDPGNSKTGDSPLQDHDWGLGVVMMRGGGSEAYIDYYDYNYDMFGNCKYRQVAGGDYLMSFDSIDCFGSVYDYNGGGGDNGIGDPVEDRFSLKIRSYIPAPYDMSDQHGRQFQKGDPLCDPSVARRGLFDTFFSEYSYFLLHRKKLQLEVSCEVAALLGIQWHRRYRFGDYVGWINQIHTTVSDSVGIEKCIVELYVL